MQLHGSSCSFSLAAAVGSKQHLHAVFGHNICSLLHTRIFAGGVLGYAQQITKCCKLSGFIEVMDASNQLMYTIEGNSHPARFPDVPFAAAITHLCMRVHMYNMGSALALHVSPPAFVHLGLHDRQCWQPSSQVV